MKPFPPQNGFCRDGGHLAGGRSYYVRNETAKMAAIIMISRPFIINRHSKAAPGASYRYTLHSPASCARSRRNFGSDGRSQPRSLPHTHKSLAKNRRVANRRRYRPCAPRSLSWSQRVQRAIRRRHTRSVRSVSPPHYKYTTRRWESSYLCGRFCSN